MNILKKVQSYLIELLLMEFNTLGYHGGCGIQMEFNTLGYLSLVIMMKLLPNLLLHCYKFVEFLALSATSLRFKIFYTIGIFAHGFDGGKRSQQ